METQVEVKVGLLEEIARVQGILTTMKVGSEEYEAAAKQLELLYNLKQSDEQLEVESIKNDEQNEQNEAERKDRQKQFWISTAIHVGEAVLAGAVYIGLATIGYKYEETGSLTAATSRNAVKDANSFFRPGKKR